MKNETIWPAIIIDFSTPPSSQQWDTFTAMVTMEAGAIGVEELEPKNNSFDSPPVKARFFFPPKEQRDPAFADPLESLQMLGTQFLPSGSFQLTPESIPEQDWGKEWRHYFKTMKIGDRLYVGPPWEGKLPADAPQDARLILIDPGQAFGTGSHETTQLCLQQLEKNIKPGQCLLDIGAGSGILGIGALFLGASFSIGVEYDEVCEENFLLNAQLNNFTEQMTFIQSAIPMEGLQQALNQGCPEPDLIVCNMLSERFYPLLSSLHQINKPLLLSGFLTTELETVKEALDREGFVICDRYYQRDEWGCLLCSPK